MYGEDFFVDDSGDGKVVEVISESFLKFDVVVMFVFVVEIVDMVYGCVFVVVVENEEVFGIFDFVGK